MHSSLQQPGAEIKITWFLSCWRSRLVSVQFVKSSGVLIYKYVGVQSFNHRWGEDSEKSLKGGLSGGCVCANPCVGIIRSLYMCCETEFPVEAFGGTRVHPPHCRTRSWIRFPSYWLLQVLVWTAKISHIWRMFHLLRRPGSACGQGQWWAGAEVRHPSPALLGRAGSLSWLLVCCDNMNLTHGFTKWGY